MKKRSLTIKCSHTTNWTYVNEIKVYTPQPRSGGKVFSVEIICDKCGVRLVGQVQEQKL